MNNKRGNLTSVEIRNLLIETIGYEKGDIDSEGKFFKMYDYQGSQADLYRLAEGLAINQKLIPSKIEVASSAWGGSPYSMIESRNTNFTRNELMKLSQEFLYLINQGIISPGAYGNYGCSLPYFHVTEYGLKCIEDNEILPHDADGYLKKISLIPNIDEWVLFYIKESLKCFNSNCLEASVIMIGLANETIMQEQINALSLFLGSIRPNLKSEMDNKLHKEISISRKYSIYQDYIDKCKAFHKEREFLDLFSKNDKLSARVYANFTRITRNELSHPSQVKMERIEVLMILMTFIRYCEIQYEFINYFNSKA